MYPGMQYTRVVFSPTGGVLRAAKLLSEGIAQGAWRDVDLTARRENQEEFAPEDVCLIAMPSYGGRAPKPALQRLRGMKGHGARAVLMAVYGNRSDDDTLYDLESAASACGFVPVAAVRAVAQHSMVGEVASGRPDEQDGRILREFGGRIAEKMEKKDARKIQLPQKDLLRPYGGVPLHPQGTRRCTGCGLCVRQCPMNAIDPKNPRLTDGSLCITCMRCASVCPEHARRLNPLMIAMVGRKLKKICAQRKEPELLL